MDDTTAFLNTKASIADINTNSKDKMDIIAIYTLYLKAIINIKKLLILHVFHIKCVIFFNRYQNLVVVCFKQTKLN